MIYRMFSIKILCKLKVNNAYRVSHLLGINCSIEGMFSSSTRNPHTILAAIACRQYGHFIRPYSTTNLRTHSRWNECPQFRTKISPAAIASKQIEQLILPTITKYIILHYRLKNTLKPLKNSWIIGGGGSSTQRKSFLSKVYLFIPVLPYSIFFLKEI